MAVKTHEFEGQQRTMAEISAMVPALGYSGIVGALAAGRNTVMAMMTFDSKAASIAGIRRAHAARGKRAMGARA